jgi:hypothetical protein
MEAVEPSEAGDDLPGAEDDLDAALGNASASLIAEELRRRVQPFTTAELVGAEAFELPDQSRGQEHVASTAALGDLGPGPDSGLRPAIREEHVAHGDDRVATVISGKWRIGYGDEFDQDKLKSLPPGSFTPSPEPRAKNHFAETGAEPVIATDDP